MPLKINLTFDLQAQERVRARDPMKFIFAGAVLLALIPIAWATLSYFNGSQAKSELKKVNSRWANLEKDYKARLEQEKEQGLMAQKAESLTNAINARPLRANTLDDVRKLVPANMELQKLRLTRMNNQSVQVTFNGVWISDNAQQDVGRYYVELRAAEAPLTYYQMDVDSIKQPIMGAITDPKRVNFEISFLLKAKKE